jgi:hypothetical protein
MEIKELTKEEVQKLLDDCKITSRMDKTLIDNFTSQGFTFNDYAMEKTVNGLHICIEFCMGDYYVGVYSKEGKWLLEDKKSFDNFLLALLEAHHYEERITNGEHWKGEEH